VTSHRQVGTTKSHEIACTLGGDEMERRVLEWSDMVSHVRERAPIPDGIRVSLDPDFPIDRLAALAGAEHECCAFLSFAITMNARGVGQEVRSTPDGMTVVAGLFGSSPTR